MGDAHIGHQPPARNAVPHLVVCLAKRGEAGLAQKLLQAVIKTLRNLVVSQFCRRQLDQLPVEQLLFARLFRHLLELFERQSLTPEVFRTRCRGD